MENLERFTTAERPLRVPDAPGLPPFDPDDVARHGADAQWRSVRDGHVVARCSVWWANVPAHSGHAPGILGHFAGADELASTRLLDCACADLAAHNCTLAIGPMDGNTWRRYRFVTERGPKPRFFLEPDNPDRWPDYFRAAGFAPLARYSSALCTDLTSEDPRLIRAAPRIERAGIRIRSIDPARFDEELSAIHALSLVSFSGNFLYAPISLEAFIAQYRPVQAAVRPELVLLAEQRDRLVGFLFTVPDLEQSRRGQPIDTIVLKTAAVLPGRIYAGLGNLLVARCHSMAAQLGYREAIHALMHDSNESRSLSSRYARPFRRYTLYAKPIGPNT